MEYNTNLFLNVCYYYYAGKPGAPSVPSYVSPQPSYVSPQPTYVSPQPTYVSPQPTYQKPSAGYPGSPGTYYVYLITITNIVIDKRFHIINSSMNNILCIKTKLILFYLF